ncbi:hypothetical protein D3C80_1840850 [compost metagenome]
MRSHILFCDKIHPITQRRHQTNLSVAEHLHQDFTLEVLIQIIERCPAQLAITSVNAPGFSFELVTNVLIGLDLATRRWRNLRITNLTVMLRILLQQPLVSLEALGQPF